MKTYAVIQYWGLGGEVEITVINTDAEPGTEEWEDIDDSFQSNFNCVLFVELTDENRKELLSLKEKIEKPINANAND